MSRHHWQELVKRYADGRKICNCGDAYADSQGMCQYGCSSNLISAKHEIAEKVLRELQNKDSCIEALRSSNRPPAPKPGSAYDLPAFARARMKYNKETE